MTIKNRNAHDKPDLCELPAYIGLKCGSYEGSDVK